MKLPQTRASLPILRASLAVLAGAVLGACADGPSAPASPAALAARLGNPPPVTIWWPTEGAHVAGVQPFKALLAGWKLSQYDMAWQVDGGQPSPMVDSYSGGAHKEAAVDVSTWTWRGAGPYTVTFVARSGSTTLSSASVHIYVDQPAPPPPPPAPGNPLTGSVFWVDPNSNAARTVAAWQSTRPADAAEMQKIAGHSQADWFGDWSGDVQSAVSARTATIVAAGALPVFVAYDIPLRDCGSYSGGGATSPTAYQSWIRAFAAGLAGRRALVVLEPDALAGMGCLSAADQQTRVQLIAYAVSVLKGANALVYIDAGNPGWQSAGTMATRLTQAGIAAADGFALNVSNFFFTADNLTYGQSISSQVGGKHFLVDTSRNGLGPAPNGEWCNPSGRGLGSYATSQTGSTLADAFLWLKRPGESDGTCNGGPAAGSWWDSYALMLAQNQPATLAAAVIGR